MFCPSHHRWLSRLLPLRHAPSAAAATPSLCRRHAHTTSPASSTATTMSRHVRLPRQHPWNRAVSEAEKLVGFPTSVLNMKALMMNDVASIATHFRKLMGTDHPVIKTLKRLVFDDKNNMQVRGLMVLLLCRSLNSSFKESTDFNQESGVLESQRKLAEHMEMIHSAQLIHKSVLNLPNFHDEPDSESKEDMQQLEYGNKLAILGGDYLLAQACVGLADLRNTEVVEMVSVAIAHFSQAEFLGRRDVQGHLIPTKEHITLDSWEHRNTLAYANLMSSTCKAAMMLAGATTETQTMTQRLGHHLSLGLQAFSELQPFIGDSLTSGSKLDLSAAPVLFHLQTDPKLLEYIEACPDNDVHNLDAVQIYEAVKSGPGVAMTQDLCHRHVDQAQEDVQSTEDGSAKEILLKMTAFLKTT